MSTEKIQVKLMSEAAEYVSVSHVIQKDYTLAELVEAMLPIVGKNAGRILQLLRVGTLSTGGFRYRWEGREYEPEVVREIMASFPGPDPGRNFEAEKCFMVRFRRGLETLDLRKKVAARQGLFARESFWDVLLQLTADGLKYADYSYADRADIFGYRLTQEASKSLRAIYPLLKPRSAGERMERLRPETIEWLVAR